MTDYNHYCCERAQRIPSTPQLLDHDLAMMSCALSILDASQQNTTIEIPIAAIITHPQHGIIAQAHNACISTQDPTAHAEICALRQAGKYLGNYRLNECTLYVTLEPCPMCFFALQNARIARIVYAAHDRQYGFLSRRQFPHHSHHFCWRGGVLAEDAQSVLEQFFRDRRN